jgi:hypothetical protein
MMARTMRPPTTPPAIAPVLVCLEPLESVNAGVLVVGVGIGASGVLEGVTVGNADVIGVDGVGVPARTDMAQMKLVAYCYSKEEDLPPCAIMGSSVSAV